jgi:hypothetical protein
MTRRFGNSESSVICLTEKNWTLIRYDIIQDLRSLYGEVRDEKIKEKALELIETEEAK